MSGDGAAAPVVTMARAASGVLSTRPAELSGRLPQRTGCPFVC